jgi:signal transduction histidine kinase
LKQFFNQNSIKLLWLAVICIVIGQSLHYVEIYKVDKRNFYANSITKKIDRIYNDVLEEHKVLSANLKEQEGIAFNDLNTLTDHPTYIFSGNNLVYWSDNKYLPRDTLLQSDRGMRYIDAGAKKFLGFQSPIEDQGIQILSLIPLYVDYNITNDFLQSGFNPEIFINSEVKISGSDEFMPIFWPEDTFLFSVEFLPGYVSGLYWLSILVFSFISLGLISLFMFFFFKALDIARKGKLIYGAGFFVIAIITTRILMLVSQFPIAYEYLPLFDSKFYASSLLNASLGDLFINLILLILFALFLWIHIPHRNIVSITKNTGQTGRIIVVLAVMLQLLVLYFIHALVQTLTTHSQWSLDVTTGFNFAMYRWFSYVLFSMGVLIILFITYFCQKIIFRHVKSDHVKFIILNLIGTLLFIASGFLLQRNLLVVSTIGFAFLYLSYVLDIKTIFVELQYRTFVYILLIFIVSALLGGIGINEVRKARDNVNRERFAQQLMQENDPMTEFFLQEASEQIQNDVFIKQRLSSPFGTKEIIEEKIRRVHLNNYLDKFEINILMFNSRGDPISPGGANSYFQIRERLAIDQYQTEYENIYFYNYDAPVVRKIYLNFIPLYRYSRTITGYIILELRLKNIIPYRVYPRLLLDDRLSLNYFEDQYDYALFRGDSLINTSGSYNYEGDFDNRNLGLDRLYTTGIRQTAYRHYGFRSTNAKTYVISSPIYPWSYFFANFSFLFIIQSFIFLLVLLGYAIYFNTKGRALNYITRIQLFLNLAFFIPLFVISLTTLTRSTTDYKTETDREYLDIVESTGNNLTSYLQNFTTNRANIEELTSNINELADFSGLDMDIFSIQQRQGRLLVPTQPLIYDKGILARVINPVAFAEIKEMGVKSLVLDESFGKLDYKIAYAGIKSYDDGRLIGILSIPFFGSQEIISRNLTGLIVNILGIFTIIFIGFIILSFIVSNYLTFPLRFVTERLRRTTLTGINEPMQYSSGDEIGRLVSEYNKMLLNLEESKKALAQTEKEAAWREMAKQVAHEIKNPLTPMKLTLQHLNMRLGELKKSERAKFEKSINSLLHNIDTLSDIATSFSDYAHMPVPEEEQFDIVRLLKESINIYINNKEIEFHTDLPDEEIMVVGDPNWIGRSVSNLIINGIQAVEEGVKPIIRLSLRLASLKRVMIIVEDNGKGIPENIREKVFMPNFSTKYSGSGIGLAIAKRAVEHAGGKLWFDTRIGFGTSFYIELPVMS